MRKMSQTKSVYMYVASNPYCTAKQVAQATQISSTIVAKLLWQLCNKQKMQAIKEEGARLRYKAVAGYAKSFNNAPRKNAKPTATKRTYTKRTVSVQTDYAQGVALLQHALKLLKVI